MSTNYVTTEHKRYYTCIDNTYLMRDDLSDRAKLMITKYLALPDSFDITVRKVSATMGWSHSATHGVIKELEEKGYYEMRKVASGNDGFTYKRTLYEHPKLNPYFHPTTREFPLGTVHPSVADFVASTTIRLRLKHTFRAPESPLSPSQMSGTLAPDQEKYAWVAPPFRRIYPEQKEPTASVSQNGHRRR